MRADDPVHGMEGAPRVARRAKPLDLQEAGALEGTTPVLAVEAVTAAARRSQEQERRTQFQ
jgi:hypothetical protein